MYASDKKGRHGTIHRFIARGDDKSSSARRPVSRRVARTTTTVARATMLDARGSTTMMRIAPHRHRHHRHHHDSVESSSSSTRRRARASRAGASSSSASRAPYDVVVVTGGLGFIGSTLVARVVARLDEFAASGATTVVVDDVDERGPYPASWKRANAVRTRALGRRVRVVERACDGAALDACVAGARRAAFIHLAARSGVGAAASDVEGACRANVETVAAVYAAAARVGNGSRVVFASSGSVYGDEASSTRASAVGDDADAPTSSYAATKRAGELLGKVYAQKMFGVEVVVTRVFTVFGPRGRPDMAIWKFIKQLESGASLTRFGDGKTTWRDYVYVDDVADALIAALVADVGDEPYRVVNVAGGAPVFLHEIIEACERACGKSGRVETLPQRPGDVGGTFADISDAVKLLDWRPRVSLEEGLRRTVEWWRSPDADAYRDVD